jgi:hypothetical protein
MDELEKKFKYKFIKNFLTKEEINLFEKYSIMRHRLNTNSFDYGQGTNKDTHFYADPIMESLMLSKMSKVEEATGLQLLPTYSFWRMYTYLSDLKKHKDRESCEISVTVMIGSSGEEWPIYMDENKVTLEKGDAVIYRGMEVEHWREEYQGDWHSQVFLHFVDKNGPNVDFKFDKRIYLGIMK